MSTSGEATSKKIDQSMRVTTAEEMRQIDQLAEQEFGITASLLMENAGRAAAQVILEEYPHAGKETEVLVFAGKGNNAGDAFVVARRLITLERKVRVFHLQSPDKYRGATRVGFDILKRLNARMSHLEAIGDLEAFFRSASGPFTIVDGILGTGLRGDLQGIFYDIVENLNQQKAQEMISLDIPTGVSGDTGRVHGSSIQADLTVSFGFPKLGHFLPPGAGRRGKLVNVDISLPPHFRREGDKYLLMRDPMRALLQERDRYGHKNSFGHTLLIGGSPGRIGAISMAARACHRMGTGLVTVASWTDSMESLLVKLPDETMSVPLKLEGPELENYKKLLPTYSSAVIGPGLGLRPEGKVLMQELLMNYPHPLVIDADALNLVSDYQLHGYLQQRKAPTVLTPHPGEMARLLNWPKEKIVEDPIRAIREAVKQTHAIVLLKGAATLIASPDDRIYLNHYPNDGMATAGSGDVLAGMIGGLLGQKMEPFAATLLGVYLHSLAGDHAARESGHRCMTASDIIENLKNAFKDLKEIGTTDSASGAAVPLETRAVLL